jgi:hypothetical protein
VAAPVAACAQVSAPAHTQVFVGYGWLSNSLNGNSGRHPLSGADVAAGLRLTRNLQAKVEANTYYGTNLQAPQRPDFLLLGVQYGRRAGRLNPWADAMAGMAHANPGWSTAPGPHSQWCVSPAADAGLDYQLTRHTAWRVQGGFVHADFTLQDYLVRKLPNYFARAATGIVVRF